VIVAGTLVILYQWTWVDPLVTLMIAGYILLHVRAEIGGVVRVLMLGAPKDLDLKEVVDAMLAVRDVDGVHQLHLWAMQEHEPSLDAHVVIAPGCWTQADRVKAEVKAVLLSRFGIRHSMLELECSRHACIDPPPIGS
jgi:cobalt-zinc-cadmium efflux system protein